MNTTARLLFVSLACSTALACGPKAEPTSPSSDPTFDDPSLGAGEGQGKRANGDAAGVTSAPAVTGKLASLLEGVRWGMSSVELGKMFTGTHGVIWKDFDDRLRNASVGPQMQALEAEREEVKAAFLRSKVEFNDTPIGYDTTPLHSEYTYGNKESLMWADRKAGKRYFFFINDRLWKVYAEVPLSDGGPYGVSFDEAVGAMSGVAGGPGKALKVDAGKGIVYPTHEWSDERTHLRLLDRSGEKLVAMVLEDNSTLSALPQLRAAKAADPLAIDPTISAVTGGASGDPAQAPADKAPAGKGGKAPKKKK